MHPRPSPAWPPCTAQPSRRQEACAPSHGLRITNLVKVLPPSAQKSPRFPPLSPPSDDASHCRPHPRVPHDKCLCLSQPGAPHDAFYYRISPSPQCLPRLPQSTVPALVSCAARSATRRLLAATASPYVLPACGPRPTALQPAIRGNSYPCDGVEIWVEGRHGVSRQRKRLSQNASLEWRRNSGESRKLGQSSPLGWPQ